MYIIIISQARTVSAFIIIVILQLPIVLQVLEVLSVIVILQCPAVLQVLEVLSVIVILHCPGS